MESHATEVSTGSADPRFFLKLDKAAWTLLRSGKFEGLGPLKKSLELADYWCCLHKKPFARLESAAHSYCS